MVPAIREARTCVSLVGIRAPGTEFFRPETKRKFRPVSPARDQISKTVRRTGRANAGFSRKVSVTRDSGNYVVGPGVLPLKPFINHLSNMCGRKSPFEAQKLFFRAPAHFRARSSSRVSNQKGERQKNDRHRADRHSPHRAMSPIGWMPATFGKIPQRWPKTHRHRRPRQAKYQQGQFCGERRSPSFRWLHLKTFNSISNVVTILSKECSRAPAYPDVQRRKTLQS
jgi:hypothetical protein